MGLRGILDVWDKVVWWKFNDVSDELTASSFKVEWENRGTLVSGYQITRCHILQDRSVCDIVTVLGIYAAWTCSHGRLGAACQSHLQLPVLEELRADLHRGRCPGSLGYVCRYQLSYLPYQQQVTMCAVVM